MKISLRSIEAFKNISELYIKKILASGELLLLLAPEHPSGTPIATLQEIICNPN